jgi:hypothetical protein
MSSESIENLLAKITLELDKTVPFDQNKRETIKRVLLESPEEIQRMTSNFKENGMDNIVTSENDFLLGTLISFIYYKFILYCAFQGNAITQNEIPLLQSCLFANGSKLVELITKVTGR